MRACGLWWLEVILIHIAWTEALAVSCFPCFAFHFWPLADANASRHEFVAAGRLGHRRFDGIIEVLGWF